MTRNVNAATRARRRTAVAAALALLSASPAAGQVRSALDREAGVPAGLALPVPGVAVAEEPWGTATTPAAVGFVGDLGLAWFREGGVTPDSRADGLYLATALGALGTGYSVEWVRPGGAASYRRSALALSLGDGRSFSLGFGWSWFASSDAAIDAFRSWDVGLTVRPWRHLSIAAATLGRDARLGGADVPLRYDLGVATRLWDDALTLSADLLADDRARDDFHATHLAFGAGLELRSGIALSGQVLVPIIDEPGVSRDVSAVVGLAWNGGHLGLLGGATALPDRTGGFGGVRASRERYRSPGSGREAPVVNVDDELERDRFLIFTVGDRDPYGLLLRRLAAARTDPDVAAVGVRIDGLPLGHGRTEELRAALAAIRERKPVFAYVTGGGTDEYWLATAATAIAVPPGGVLDVSGFRSTKLYLKTALARAGVAFDVVARGAYKTAPEPLVRAGASPESREVTNAVLDDVFGRMIADVAAARRLAPDKVRAAVDAGLLGSEQAKAEGLVDDVLWPDELERWASRVAGKRVRLGGPYRPEPQRRAQRWGRPAIVEVVQVEGTIVSGKSRGGPFGGGGLAGAETIAKQLRRAAADRDVKAIVLRVDSPGGDGLASDLVWREVVRARARKPVVASMGDVAASGGYLVAVGADAIVAEPSTLTGSVGVFGLKPDLSGLLSKLSISREAFARGENAQWTSVAKPWTASERRAIEKQIEAFYRLFVDRVAEGRKLPRGEIEPLAGGRVWTGKQAFERRLVDRLGSVEDAIALARERAHLGSGDWVEVRRSASGPADLGDLVGEALADVAAAGEPPVSRALGALPEVRALALLAELGPVVALPVEWVLPP
ncbi:MAG TPA: signal peptide peptidase SppA [Anaeromyxobacter sp.]|nr:signal peptide peptidase SppA [Anaeromyxobacter sp.]